MPQRHLNQDFLSSAAALKTNENHVFVTKGILSQALNSFQGNGFTLYPCRLGAIGIIFLFSAKMLPGNCRDALNFVSLTFLHLPLEMQAGLPDWPIKNNKHCQDICMEIILLINIFCIAPWITCY